MNDYDWLFDPEYECTCFLCGRNLPRRLTYLFYGELYCDKCFELINQEGYNDVAGSERF